MKVEYDVSGRLRNKQLIVIEVRDKRFHLFQKPENIRQLAMELNAYLTSRKLSTGWTDWVDELLKVTVTDEGFGNEP